MVTVFYCDTLNSGKRRVRNLRKYHTGMNIYLFIYFLPQSQVQELNETLLNLCENLCLETCLEYGTTSPTVFKKQFIVFKYWISCPFMNILLMAVLIFLTKYNDYTNTIYSISLLLCWTKYYANQISLPELATFPASYYVWPQFCVWCRDWVS